MILLLWASLAAFFLGGLAAFILSPADLPSKSTLPESGSKSSEFENETSPDADVALEEGAAGVEDRPQ